MTFWKLTLAAGAILIAAATANAAPLASPTETYPNDCSKADNWTPGAPQRAVDPKRLSPEQRAVYFAQLLDYVCSGDYLRDITNVADSARSYLAHRTAGGTPGGKFALVLDIDETSLSNEVQILGGSLRFPSSGGDDDCSDPLKGCGYTTWELMGKAEALRPTLALFRQALRSGVHVFFITGRYEDNRIAAAPAMRDATAANLTAAGYAGYTCLFLQPNGAPSWNCTDVAKPPGYPDSFSGGTAQFKSAVRKAISAAGYTIVLNMGDQPGDLGTTSNWSKDEPAEASFLLPNPFY